MMMPIGMGMVAAVMVMVEDLLTEWHYGYLPPLLFNSSTGHSVKNCGRK